MCAPRSPTFSMQDPSACVPLARTRPRRHARGDCLSPRRARRVVHPAGEGTPVHGRDQHGAHHRLPGDCEPWPGQPCRVRSVNVRVSLTNRCNRSTSRTRGMTLVAGPGSGDHRHRDFDAPLRDECRPLRRTLTVTVPADAPVTRPYFERASINESRYTIRKERTTINAEPAEAGFSCAICAFCVVRCDPAYRPAGGTRVVRAGAGSLGRPAFRWSCGQLSGGASCACRTGEELRELMVVPAVAVNVTPRVAVVPTAASRKQVDVRVELREQPSRWRQRTARVAAAARLLFPRRP